MSKLGFCIIALIQQSVVKACSRYIMQRKLHHTDITSLILSERASITDISRHHRNATVALGSLALSRHPAQPAGSVSVLLRTMTVRTSSVPPSPRAPL